MVQGLNLSLLYKNWGDGDYLSQLKSVHKHTDDFDIMMVIFISRNKESAIFNINNNKLINLLSDYILICFQCLYHGIKQFRFQYTTNSNNRTSHHLYRYHHQANNNNRSLYWIKQTRPVCIITLENRKRNNGLLLALSLIHI